MAVAGWPHTLLSRSFGVCASQILLFGLLIRCMTSLHSYSGARNPPKYGDYEAQRHWMEITINIPMRDWYRNTSDNDLQYWGLDYPPLSAYQSYLHGRVMQYFEPASVALHTSRGYENPSSKLLMRWAVLSSDAVLFFPAALLFVLTYYGKRSTEDCAAALAALILQPTLIIIDHGHFQFNCISLGLVIAAAAAVVSRQDLLTCVLFSMSVNHKQMSMYYAPAFFAHLLGRCLQERKPAFGIFKLGFYVITTFIICWWPFLSSKEAVLEVIARVVPLQRGIYEDYVSNFWCVTAIWIKWKQRFSVKLLAHFALGSTILAMLPSMVQQILAPSQKGFLLAMFNSSFAFYMFSYLVHEKSILVPLLPAALLVLDDPWILRWLTPSALLSMFPLIRRDNLVLAHAALYSLFLFLSPSIFNVKGKATTILSSGTKHSLLKRLNLFSLAATIIIPLCYLLIPPPTALPFLFDLIISTFAFAHFFPLLLYTNYKQWLVAANGSMSTKSEKKKSH